MNDLLNPKANAVGANNADLPAATSRMIKGGSYKRQRIISLIPAIVPIHPRVYLAHRCLIFPPNQPCHHLLAEGDEVGLAYSRAIESILAIPQLAEFEYLLTIEADNAPLADGVMRLVASMEAHPELGAIGGLYWTKGAGGVPQIWGDVRDPQINFRPQAPQAGQLVECCGTGMGFNLWRLAMFRDERLRRPFFKTLAGRDGVSTQDLYFWTDARKHGYRCAVDCSVLVGHHDAATDTMW